MDADINIFQGGNARLKNDREEKKNTEEHKHLMTSFMFADICR